jgi:hypothetical protein
MHRASPLIFLREDSCFFHLTRFSDILFSQGEITSLGEMQRYRKKKENNYFLFELNK